jgi:hypothetical protein
MAYAVVNKSGCAVRKGNCQIRLDFYLEQGEPRYAERYLVGNPPFHSHFIYLDAGFTEKDIKRAIDIHLPNFYKAFQDGWDATAGGMRHGWATETRIEPTDSPGARVNECQASIDALSEIVYKPSGEFKGRTYPATAIDVGSPAINRSGGAQGQYTFITVINPANDTGVIDTFELWSVVDMYGTKVDTFYGSGASYTNRAGALIGLVTHGAKQTFTGLVITVSIGDFAGVSIGYSSPAGQLEREPSGGSNFYYKAGDQFGTGLQTYGLWDAVSQLSLYGTGATLASGIQNKSPSMGAKLIAGKLI